MVPTKAHYVHLGSYKVTHYVHDARHIAGLYAQCVRDNTVINGLTDLVFKSWGPKSRLIEFFHDRVNFNMGS